MMTVEYVSLVANLGALSVVGVLYAAYIKNIKSQVSLKDEQLKTAEQNIRLWKDKVLDLERQTPQYVEKILAERIRIREDEIVRLAKDEEDHRFEIEQKNTEVSRLKTELEAAHEFGRGISIYDSKSNEFKQLSVNDLELKDLGEVWVDSATLMICDPMHLSMSREDEIECYPVTDYRYRELETGETFYVESEDTKISLDGHDNAQISVRQLVEMGRLERLPIPTVLPVDPDSYIKGGRLDVHPNKTKAGTFYNGTFGAGLIIGTRGDGSYMIRGEVFEGEIRRILIDLY